MRTAIIEKYHADLAQVREYLAKGRAWPWIQCQMNITNSKARRMRKSLQRVIVTPPTREEMDRRAQAWEFGVA